MLNLKPSVMKKENAISKTQSQILTSIEKNPDCTKEVLIKKTKMRPNVVGATLTILIKLKKIKKESGKNGDVFKLAMETKPTKLPKLSAGRNKDKYELQSDGIRLGKGKMALRLLHLYSQKYPKATLADYIKVFPAELQKNYGGMFAVSKSIKKNIRNRYFLKTDQLIKTGDGQTLAVVREFGAGNIEGVILKARELKFQVKVHKGK